MEAHIGVRAGTGYVHSVAATVPNVPDLEEVASPIRDVDEVVYGHLWLEVRPRDYVC